MQNQIRNYCNPDLIIPALVIGFSFYIAPQSLNFFLLTHTFNTIISVGLSVLENKRWISKDKRKIASDSLNFLNVCACESSKHQFASYIEGLGFSKKSSMDISIVHCLAYASLQKHIFKKAVGYCEASFYNRHEKTPESGIGLTASYFSKTAAQGAKYLTSTIWPVFGINRVYPWFNLVANAAEYLVSGMVSNGFAWHYEKKKFTNRYHYLASSFNTALSHTTSKSCTLSYTNPEDLSIPFMTRIFGLMATDSLKELLKGTVNLYAIKPVFRNCQDKHLVTDGKSQ